MNKMKILLIIIFLSQTLYSINLAFCETELQCIWVKEISIGSIENGGVPTSDGGFVFATYSPINLVKTDSNGELQWSKPLGSTYWRAFSTLQTDDGGYIVAGGIDLEAPVGQPGNEQILVIKTDSSGEGEWYKTYGSPLIDSGTFIQKTNDGGYVVVGYSENSTDNRDLSILKIDKDGNQLWLKYYSAYSSIFPKTGTFNDLGNMIRQTTDGGYIAVGQGTVDPGGSVVFLVKTDSDGNLLWKKSFPDFEASEGYDVIEMHNGDYVITGNVVNLTGLQQMDVLIMDVDKSGNLVWSNQIGYKNMWQEGYRILTTKDGGFLIAGFIFDPSILNNDKRDYDVYVVKTDSLGNKLWDRRYFSNPLWNEARSLHKLSDGNYIIMTRNLSPGGGGRSTSLIKFAEPGPSNLIASSVTNTSITLLWSNYNSHETESRIERKTQIGTWEELASLPPNSTSYIDTGLTAGTSYTYRIRGIQNNTNSDSLYSNEASVITKPKPTIFIIKESTVLPPNTSVLVLDNNTYSASQLPLNQEWNTSNIHTYSWKQELPVSNGQRLIWVRGSGLSETQSGQITSDPKKGGVLSAEYRIQYKLTINSQYPVTGDGWFDANSTVTFKAGSPGGFLVRTFFSGWTGDIESEAETESLIMDSPKTITAIWISDYSGAFIAGGVIMTLAFVVAALIIQRGRVESRRSSRIEKERRLIEELYSTPTLVHLAKLTERYSLSVDEVKAIIDGAIERGELNGSYTMDESTFYPSSTLREKLKKRLNE